jgi:hypothetical protein
MLKFKKKGGGSWGGDEKMIAIFEYEMLYI